MTTIHLPQTEIYKPLYHIDCANCGHYNITRERLTNCPSCRCNLIEKRYLM